MLDHETLCSSESFSAASYAVGATIQAIEKGDFALVRPPGHHSFRGRSSGFCIFNNLAIAAQYLVNKGKKVLIFDFDGHFGNGTSDIFYESDQVLCWSIHQHPGYPDTGISTNIGSGKGTGFNINVELPPGSGDDIYMDAINTFLPLAKQFNPDYVGVSAGFDAHKTDMMLDLKVSLDSYYKTGQILKNNFNNIFAVLEGGYNPNIVYQGVENFMAGINGDKIRFSETLSETDIKIMDVYEHKLTSQIVNLRNYWKF